MNSFVTKTGVALNEEDIESILKEWGTDIQIGETYSFNSIVGFIIDCMNNSLDNFTLDKLAKHVSIIKTEDQREIINVIIKSIENYKDQNE